MRQDPSAQITSVYAFVGTRFDNPAETVLNVIVHVRPFSVPGDGGIYERFADDALYCIHVTHPATGETILRYDFQFSAVTGAEKNPHTILSYGLGDQVGPIQAAGDGRQNYSQTYTVTWVSGDQSVVLGADLMTPPPNVGPRTTPLYNDPSTGRAISGATAAAELDKYTRETIHELPSGEVVFAGSREDGFYGDIPAIFDLLDPRLLGDDGIGQTGGGVDAMKGFNVLAYAIQVPLSSLTSFEYHGEGGPQGVGVYASIRRKLVAVRESPAGAKPDPSLFSADCNGDHEIDISDAVCLLSWLFLGGPPPPRVDEASPWVQVSRMGNPLFNALFVPVKDKDRYHATDPTGDGDRATGFAQYARTPEIARLFNLVFGTTIAETDRDDLVSLYIPDVIRVNTTTPPVSLPGRPGFSRLGWFGGDTVLDGRGGPESSGWPNGRRPGDDVVDIVLTWVFSKPELTSPLGDNVHANDQLYHQVFPYSATPHAGTTDLRR